MSEFKLINSSNLDAAAYDDQAKEMIVRFKNDTAYRYFDVSPELWRQFEDTFSGEDGKSAGKFFYPHVRGLSYEKIED